MKTTVEPVTAEIERGIPTPAEPVSVIRTVRALEPGESVTFTGARYQTVWLSAWKVRQKRPGVAHVVRRLPDGRTRVWRTA